MFEGAFAAVGERDFDHFFATLKTEKGAMRPFEIRRGGS
jgi:hypothetical protein